MTHTFSLHLYSKKSAFKYEIMGDYDLMYKMKKWFPVCTTIILLIYNKEVVKIPKTSQYLCINCPCIKIQFLMWNTQLHNLLFNLLTSFISLIQHDYRIKIGSFSIIVCKYV